MKLAASKEKVDCARSKLSIPLYCWLKQYEDRSSLGGRRSYKLNCYDRNVGVSFLYILFVSSCKCQPAVTKSCVEM
jgi:hypothetical protein